MYSAAHAAKHELACLCHLVSTCSELLVFLLSMAHGRTCMGPANEERHVYSSRLLTIEGLGCFRTFRDGKFDPLNLVTIPAITKSPSGAHPANSTTDVVVKSSAAF